MILQSITFNELKKIPTDPGIYLLTNLANNKHYVGQAKNLRLRLRHHYYTYKKGGNGRMILYNGMLKYGIDNFTISILETLDTYDVPTLDSLEIKYIAEYDSYGENGYNLTKGGGGGVLGYKMTEEQKKIISENSKKEARDGRHTVYVYDRNDGSIKSYLTRFLAAEAVGGSVNSLKNSLSNKTYYLKRYIFARSLEDLNVNIKTYKLPTTNDMSLDEYYQYMCNRMQSGQSMNRNLVAEDLHISRDTISKRDQKLKALGYDLIWKTYRKISKIIAIDIVNNKTFETNFEELANMFNTSADQARKIVSRHPDEFTLYKKQYYFKIVYGNNILT